MLYSKLQQIMDNFFKKSLNLFLKRQTNILSAAFVIMGTVIFSQFLGLIRQRLLASIYGASSSLGVYLAASQLPNFLFQLVIAGALTSAFIPVFSDYLSKGKTEEANKVGSTFLAVFMSVFFVLSCVLFVFAQPLAKLVAPGFSHSEVVLMANLTRIIIVGELLFIVGSFLSAVLQSYNHFFIPGIASSLYNLGIIIGIVFLSPAIGIFSAAYGVVLGSLIFVVIQLPVAKMVGFVFRPQFNLKNKGVRHIITLMWPRTISIAIFQVGTLATVTLVSFITDPGRHYVIFDYAQTLAFAPVALFGQTIAQAAFPVLSRERERLSEFKLTFMTSFNQMLYLVLPVSALFFVLRIPIVRLVFGAGQFDWGATVLTGRTLAFFSFSIFSQAIIYLVSRGFYALHDTKTPLIIGTLTTLLMLLMGFLFVVTFHFGVESIAIAYSLASLVQLLFMMIYLDKKVGGFNTKHLFIPLGKIFVATFFTGFALYIPIKLLDQLVFDTTKTVNLIMLTGISSLAGLSFYLFLTWIFNVEEAKTFILLFRKIGNWREILQKSDTVIDGNLTNP